MNWQRPARSRSRYGPAASLSEEPLRCGNEQPEVFARVTRGVISGTARVWAIASVCGGSAAEDGVVAVEVVDDGGEAGVVAVAAWLPQYR